MYDGPIIDTDIHQSWHTEADVRPYLEPRWRRLTTGELGGNFSIIPPYRVGYRPASNGGMRLEAIPPNGWRPGSVYTMLRDQVLDRFQFERVVLCHDSARNNGLLNPYFAQAAVRAINDWVIDTWLAIPDERLYAMLVIPAQFPDEGAAEIRRVGRHPRIVGAIMGWNSLYKPLGHPLYHPIYEAAAEMDLPIAIHINAGEQSWGPAQMNASGLPGNFFEYFNVFMQPMMAHLCSIFTHGVFEKFPNLKLFCMECGLSWIPWLFWNLDDHYRLLRRESACLKRRPSEYLREHVRFTTQPLEESSRREQLIEVLESFGGMEDLLCFSTDYPHWDTDDTRIISGRLPQSWHRKVFYENARHFFRWPSAALPVGLVGSAGASLSALAEN